MPRRDIPAGAKGESGLSTKVHVCGGGGVATGLDWLKRVKAGHERDKQRKSKAERNLLGQVEEEGFPQEQKGHPLKRKGLVPKKFCLFPIDTADKVMARSRTGASRECQRGRQL